MQNYEYRMMMRYRDELLARDMRSPVRCGHCGHVYDLGKVTVTACYTDCSVWRTPCCDTTVDDPCEYGVLWGGRADYERIKVAGEH